MRRIEVRAFENGKLFERSAIAERWARFLNGGWTRTAPRFPGKYVVANRTGRVVGEVLVPVDPEAERLAVRISDGALCKVEELQEGRLWWWSRPMPLMMPIPTPRGRGGPGHGHELLRAHEEAAGLNRRGESRGQKKGKPVARALRLVGPDDES